MENSCGIITHVKWSLFWTVHSLWNVWTVKCVEIRWMDVAYMCVYLFFNEAMILEWAAKDAMNVVLH